MRPKQLILIPGLMCNAAVWSPLFPHLDLSVDQISVPDHGMASSLSQMAERILKDAPERFCLAGHSMGGRVALEIMRLAPERVERLALLDTGFTAREAGAKGQEEQTKRLALLQIAREHGVRAMAQQWSQGMVHPDRLSDTALMTAILDMFEEKTAEIFAAQINALLARPDASEVLQRIAVPTLVACGQQDSWATPAQHEALHALIPSAHMRLVAQAGHMAPMERPQETAAIINEWLAA